MENNQNSKKIFRSFKLTDFAVDNRTSMFLLVIMIGIFGWSSYRSMPKELFPEVVIPTIYISTIYPGNSAADIEDVISKPIENQIKSITGIKSIKSTSAQGYSNVIVEFETDIDIPDALQDVKDAVDKAKNDLPQDLPRDPNVFDINFSEFPIVAVNLSGEYSVDELRGYAEYLEDEIEALTEVSKVDIKGALEREVKIDMDLQKMQAVQISFYDVEQAIRAENITISGGEIESNGFKRDIRVVGQFDNVNQISNIIVKSENLNPVYLRDIADVSLGYKDATSYARSDRLPVVSLDVVKRSGYNLLDASDKIKGIVEKAQAEKFPEDLKVFLFNDQSIKIRKQVSELENSIISGVILVVLVLLFFLGLRNAAFVGVAIPLSMLMGIMILNLMGVVLNLMVLFSLILALGLLVDNGIVVVENIYRYMQEGYSSVEAAKKGTGEVAVAIIASTATTLAAFLPLAFWPGIIGSFMFALPLTLIIVLTSSLIVALVFNPIFTARFMKIDEKAETKDDRKRKVQNFWVFAGILLVMAVLFAIAGNTTFRNLFGIVAGLAIVNFYLLRPASFYFQNTILPILENAYDKFIRFALRGRNPMYFFVGTIGLFIGTFLLLGAFMPKVIFFPTVPPQYINVFVEMPFGTDIEETNDITKEIEEKVTKTVEPYKAAVDAILTQIGEGTGDPGQPSGDGGSTPHKARVTVSFVQPEYRQGINTFDILEKIRADLQGYAGVSIVVDKNADGPPTGKPVNIELQGEDVDKLSELSTDMIKYINSKKINGIEELQADVKLAKPQILVEVDREAARRYGISTRDIGMALRSSIYGSEVTDLKIGDDEYPIFIRLSEKYRHDIDALMNQPVTFRNPGNGQIAQVPISAVAKIEYSTTYTSIKRKDTERAITVFSNVNADANPNEVVNDIKLIMDDYKMPEGYSYKFTGEQEEQEANMAFLSTAFTVALFAIFIIIVSQFNSIISPFIILSSIILSLIGVFLGYVISGMDFVLIMTGVGIISLAGVVVNNAIVLIDYIELTRKRKREEHGYEEKGSLHEDDVRESIVHAGKTRLRPVLLTAITTILGLIPLAIGLNINFTTLITDFDPEIFIGGDNVAFWGPMSWTVIYGLTFATFLTLVIVPVMYWLADRMEVRFNDFYEKYFTRKKSKPVTEPIADKED
jgi:multidrug efflux pump subunit AcrB